MLQPRPYQTEACKTVIQKWKDGVTRQIISLPTACHAKGQGILMYDGSIKKVEDVKVGDLVMGDDSTPRTVLELHHGFDDMYKIIPHKGDPFVVNKSHELALISTPEGKPYPCNTTGYELDIISVQDYLKKSKYWKHLRMLYRNPVLAFGNEATQLPIPPYILGVLLGDGSLKHQVGISSTDPEVVDAWTQWVVSVGCEIRVEASKSCPTYFARGLILDEHHHSPNTVKGLLRGLNLLGHGAEEKFIPQIYKTSTWENRLQLIAGLLDTDGYLNYGKEYDFISKSKQLAEDLAFVCRSIGMYVSIRPCLKTCTSSPKGRLTQQYYRLTISGDCTKIPCRVPRRKALPRRTKRRHLVTMFDVKEAGTGEYFGFTVDGNNLFLLDDFTVVKNSGKTICFGMIAKELHQRTLIIAHRDELLQQAKQKIKLIWPTAKVDILQAQKSDGLKADVCVASIQTAVRRIPQLRDQNFRLAICDEAHHIVAKTYRTLFKELGFLNDNPHKLLLGVTATAFRADKEQLGDIFQEISYEKSILSMIRAGYLSDVRGLIVETLTDISNVTTRTGDFAIDELSEAVDTPQRNELVVDTFLQYGENRHGVVFAVKVDHAIHLAEEFKKKGIKCEAVYGTMSLEQRQDILSRYAKGEIQLLTNVAILTEGWDSPSTDVILLARPTQSQGLAIQMIGRGLRTAPNKKDCLVIDFVDTTKKHNLCGVSLLTHNDEGLYDDDDLFKDKGKKDSLGALDEPDDSGFLLDDAKLEAHVYGIDLFDRSQFMWQTIGSNYRIWLADGSSVCCYMENPEAYTPILVLGNGKCQKLSDEPLPMGYALGVCEDYVRQMNARYATVSRKDAEWRSLPATDKQKTALQNMGLIFDENINRGQASVLLEGRLNIPPTPKQLWFINKYKLHDMPQLLTKAEASRLIERAKAEEELKPRKKRRF